MRLVCPMRSELIVVWSSNNPVLDARYWALLSRTTTNTSEPSSSKGTAVWLGPLLVKIPMFSIVAALAQRLGDADVETLEQCSTTLTTMIAITGYKPTFDSAWEAISELLAAVGTFPQDAALTTSWPERAKFASTVLRFCQPVLAEYTNKKKVHCPSVDDVLYPDLLRRQDAVRFLGRFPSLLDFSAL